MLTPNNIMFYKVVINRETGQKGGTDMEGKKFVPFKDERSEKVKSICHQYKADGCRDTCPLSEACKMHPQDNLGKFLARMNEAAETLQGKELADSIFENACALNRALADDLLRCA